MEIILASQSPRRRELLERMGLSFSVRAADIDEAMEPGKDPAQEVARVSRAKAMAAPAGPQDVVIAADTIVVCGGRILGKPGTEERAAEMLRLLSGRDHQVMTGFTVRRGSTVLTQTEVSHIFFRPLDEGEIDAYVATGEPLDNYDNVRKFIELLTDENGLHISQRNVTLSTCGIVPNIRRLADEELQITLALSLHASSQEKREKLMPIAKQYELSEVMDACRYYHDKTGRRLTFEYSLVGGVNDHTEDARELAGLLKGLNGHVNLIPVNPIKERDFVQPTSAVTQAFKNKLEKYGINVTIRREMGRDINGACGQLRRSYMEKNKGEEEI